MLLSALMLLTALGALHHLPEFNHVLQAVNHPGICRFTVATGTPGFLIIGLDRLGQVQMRYKAHIRFINAHTKGNSRHYNHAFFAQES